MKPNFALDFRNDAITLLHRTPGGWQLVGTVGLDADDLAASLSRLRTTALELSPKGMTTKLVIPNSQILYTQVPVTAPDTARRRKQVARGLDGVTPYPVADLAFDMSGTGPTVDVAVIAKETLAEAEAFATEHRFNPVSFVAVPETLGFDSEPWFGPTGCATNHLAEGQRVDRDPTPIVILGLELPKADALVTEQPAPEAMVADTVVAETGAADTVVAGATVPEPGVAEPTVTEPTVAEPAEVEPVAAAPAAKEPVVDDPLSDRGQRTSEPVSSTRQPGLPQSEPTTATALQELAAVPEAVRNAGAAADLEPERGLKRASDAQDRLPPAVPDSLPADLSPANASSAVTNPDDTVASSAPSVSNESDRLVGNDPLTIIVPPQIAPLQPSSPDDEAPMALDVVDDLPDDRGAGPPLALAGVLNPSIPDDDIPPPPATSIMVAFGSRRALETSAKEAAAKAGATKTGAARPSIAKVPVLAGISATRTVPNAKVTMLPTRSSQSGVVRLPPRPSMPVSTLGDPARDPGKTTIKPAGKQNTAGKALRGLGALVTSPNIAGARERRPAVPPVVQMITPPTGPSPAAAAAAATLNKAGTKPYSGGLGNRSLQRAKPRYLGLILTGILLVFLVLVAAWSTLFLESRDTTTPDPNAVVDAAPAEGDVLATADEVAVDPEMLADLQGPAAEDFVGEAATAQVPVAQAPVAQDPVAQDPVAQDPTPAAKVASDPLAEAVASTVAEAVADRQVEPAPAPALDTEAAEAVPLDAAPQDEFLLATMDGPPSMPDAASLPQPLARNDAPPGPAVPPPPFGTVYQFDPDGLIVPTPEGILTPEGVLLFAGRPAPEPPARPASLAAETPESAAGTLAAEASAATDGSASFDAAQAVADPAPAFAGPAPAFADPALAGARPRQRPEGLSPTTQNADDDASLAPEVSSRFSGLRPLAKPAALVNASATAPTNNPPASPPANPFADLGAQAASLTAQANATPNSPMILAVSRKPAPRPKDMSRAVEEAVAIASRQPEPLPEVEQPAARTELEADNEPEVTKAMPRLPTRTSVAKQATFVNAINLSKVNLIGIYGSASNRYALIRQPNGRYKKVKVGDNFDGGRVAAITTSEVRYQKSGKMVTLALPKG
jgi:Tfp pilus assembly protein PilP